MPELLQTLLVLLGLVGAHYADPGEACPNGACPAVPDRPAVAWTAPQTLRADEVRLFSRSESRPGEHAGGIPAAAAAGREGEREVWIVAPATERLRPVLAGRARVEVRLLRAPAPR